MSLLSYSFLESTCTISPAVFPSSIYQRMSRRQPPLVFSRPRHARHAKCRDRTSSTQHLLSRSRWPCRTPWAGCAFGRDGRGPKGCFDKRDCASHHVVMLALLLELVGQLWLQAVLWHNCRTWDETSYYNINPARKNLDATPIQARGDEKLWVATKNPIILLTATLFLWKSSIFQKIWGFESFGMGRILSFLQ